MVGAATLVLALAGCDRTDRSFGEEGVASLPFPPAAVVPVPASSGERGVFVVSTDPHPGGVSVGLVSEDGALRWRRELPASFHLAGTSASVWSDSTRLEVAVPGRDNGGELQVALVGVDGQLVSSWGDGGIASTGIIGSRAVVLAGGRLIVAQEPGGIVQVWLDQTGRLQSQWHMKTSIELWDAIVAPDFSGKVYVVGQIRHDADSAGGSATADMAVLRTSNEFRDPSFGTDGLVLVSPGAWDRAEAVVARPDGRLVIGGISTTGGHTRLALAGLLPDGRPDPGFGLYGMSIVDQPSFSTTDLVAGGPGFVLLSTAYGNVVTHGFDDRGVLVDAWGDHGRQANDIDDSDVGVALGLVGSRLLVAAATVSGTEGALLGLRP